MVSVNPKINVSVNATEVERLEAKLNRVHSILDRINRDPIAIDDGRAAKQVQEIAGKISNLAREQLKLNTINMTTVAGLKDKAAAYRLVADNAKVGQELFKNATIASERFSRRAATADQERLKVLKEFYSTQILVSKNQQPVRTNYGLEELARQQKLAFGTNSIASLEAFNNELQRTYELMSGNASGRSQLLDMMTETDKRLQMLQRPSQKAPGVVRPAGPATELGSPKEYIQRQKAADDLLATNRKLERISVNLDAAAISQNDKAAIRNRLEEAFNKTKEQNFALAQKLGAEADRYLRDAKSRQTSLERLDRQRLRVQSLNEKAAEKTSLYTSNLESNFGNGIPQLDRWLQKLNRIEQAAIDINDISIELGKNFDERLKGINYREGSLKTPLGGGAEVAARARYSAGSGKDVQMGPAVKLGTGQQLREENKYEAEKVQLRNQIAEATNRAAAAVQRLESAQGRISMVQQFEEIQSAINGVSDEVDRFLEKDRKALSKFNRDLAESSRAARQKQGIAVDLGGGAELLARQQYEKDSIANVQRKAELGNIVNRQLIALKTLSADFNILEGKGVVFLDEKTRLSAVLTAVEQKRFDINEENIKVIGEELKTLRAIVALRKSESEAAGTYRGQASKTGGKSEAEIIEARRNRLLENALSLQSNLVSIEGRGGQVAQEKLELEAKILYLKNLQNKASEADLQIIAQQIQELRIKGKTVSNAIPVEQTKLPFLERRFGKEKAGAISEGLVGGAFPLLFGQGVGASLGGLAGGAAGGFLGGGLGFGLSLVGTSVGAALDQSVAAAKELGNALAISKDNYSELRQQGIYFTAELENQVRLAKEGGQFQQAQQLQRGAAFAQTGDVDTTAIRGAAAASNELQKAWSGIKSAVGTTLAAIATPFIFALTGALRIVQGIFFVFNLIPGVIGKLAGLIPGVEGLRQNLEESAIRGTEEYENQLAEINKQISAADKLNKISTEKNNILQQSLGSSKVEYDFAVKRAEAQERVNKLEKEIQDFRASAPTGTSELRAKAATQEAQMRFKFAEEERSIFLGNAREIFDAVTESNRRIAELKKQYEREYSDLVRQNLREQEDFNLSVARKVQDTRIQAQEQELNYTKQIAQERIKGIQLANQEQSFRQGIDAQLSSDPRGAALVNEVKTAVEEWRIGRRSVEEEYAAKQREIQLQAQKAEIAIQRYKFDNALRIARANEDSQLKINRLQEQINRQNEAASRDDFKRQQENLLNIVEFRKAISTEQYFVAKSQVDSMNVAPNAFTQEQKMRADKDLQQAMIIYGTYKGLVDTVKQTIASMPVASRLPSLGPAPKLTDTSSSSTEASQAALDEANKYEQQVSVLTRLNNLKQQDLDLAKKLLDPQSKQLEQLNEIITTQEKVKKSKERYRDLLLDGVDPALAQELARIEQIRDIQLENLDTIIKTLEAYKDPALKDVLEKLGTIRSGVSSKANTAISGARSAFAPGEKTKDFIAQATAELNDLESLGIRVSQSIGDAVGNSLNEGITGLIEGTTTAEQVFADFLRNIGQILIQEGAKIIATYIAIGIAKAFAGLAGDGFSFKGAGPVSGSSAFGGGVSGFNPGVFAMPRLAANGAYFSNGVAAFANGGIVNSPTLFQFADGGVTQPGVMGEAGPEAIMPLQRDGNGRLGVKATGVVEALAAARGALSDGQAKSAGDPFAENRQALGGISSVERERNVERIISSGASSTEIKYSRVGSGDLPFVTEEDMLQATRVAAQEGAKLGQQRTLAALKNNPGARRTVGI